MDSPSDKDITNSIIDSITDSITIISKCVECKTGMTADSKHVYGICVPCMEKRIQYQQERIDTETINCNKYQQQIQEYLDRTISLETFETYCDEHNQPIHEKYAMKQAEKDAMDEEYQKYCKLYRQYQSDYEEYKKISSVYYSEITPYLEHRNPAMLTFFGKYQRVSHELIDIKEQLIINAHEASDTGLICKGHAKDCSINTKGFRKCCYNCETRYRELHRCNCSYRLYNTHNFNKTRVSDLKQSIQKHQQTIDLFKSVMTKI
jgi:hypothetical protein